MRLPGWGRTAPHHSSAHSSLPLCRDLGLSLCILLSVPPLHCKQTTQFWVLRWWRNFPPLPTWPFQSLTERTGGRNTMHSGWSTAVGGECLQSLLLGRVGMKWGWHGARHWDVFCHSIFCFIWYSISYISVPNGGSAIDINYLSITVRDTINLLSAGYTTDWN